MVVDTRVREEDVSGGSLGFRLVDVVVVVDVKDDGFQGEGSLCFI